MFSRNGVVWFSSKIIPDFCLNPVEQYVTNVILLSVYLAASCYNICVRILLHIQRPSRPYTTIHVSAYCDICRVLRGSLARHLLVFTTHYYICISSLQHTNIYLASSEAVWRVIFQSLQHTTIYVYHLYNTLIYIQRHQRQSGASSSSLYNTLLYMYIVFTTH